MLDSVRAVGGHRADCRRPGGFTLIELLVVIAVIAIIAAILFPVFAKVRDKARQTQCLSNLKQLGFAFAAYQQDNDGLYPYWDYDSSSSSGSVTPNNATSLWINAIYPYVKSPQVYQCPNANDQRSLQATYLWGWIDPAKMATCGILPALMNVPVHYGYNEMISELDLCPDNNPCADNGVDRPSETFLVADSAQGLTNTLGGRPDRNNPSDPLHQYIITRVAYANAPLNCFADPIDCGAARTGPPSSFAAQISEYQAQVRHVTGSNVDFVDGHAKWMNSSLITYDLYGGDYPE